MTTIKIKRLALENFKCHKSLVLNFDGGDATIYGDNATGKTSIYDALTWLLFGKDSQGNGEKNIEIKPLGADGEVRDHMAETAVEAVLLVDGEEVTFKRTYKEVWTTKRGSGEPTYDGNTSEYYVDGVPCKKFAFTEKVDSLMNEDTFRMLTSVSHFAAGITWQERREVLFRVAGVMSDAQIMAEDERFQPLIEGMGKLSLEDYKKKLLAEKRGFVGAKTEIPARISECRKTIEDVEGIDFDGARAEVERLTAKRGALEAEVIAIENDVASDHKRMEIREANVEFNTLQAENNAYRMSQTASAPDMAYLRRNLNNLQTRLDTKKNLLGSAETIIANCDKEIAASRTRWIEVNGETFTGGTCPTCGQALPTKQLKDATEAFEAHKKERLREIEQTANARKEAKAQYEARLAELSAEISGIREEICQAETALDKAKSQIVEPVDMAGYEEKRDAVEKKLRTLEGELADIAANTSAVKGNLQKQIREVAAEIEAQRAIISKESLLEYSRKRVEELQEDARSAAECLEAIEKVLWLMDEYARYKTQYVEDSINGLFRIARFRLFREQANGGLEDRCDVVYEGVPYINVNNGAKINVGIDIINTLSRAYGVTVPLFVDNAESVTALEKSECQIIRLVVSENDKKLRCEYEN